MANREDKFKQFLSHEETALKEVGQAILSILPEGLRTHGQKAVDEAGKGVSVLAELVEDEVNGIVKPIRERFSRSEEKPQEEVAEA